MRINKSFSWKRWFSKRTRLNRIKICLFYLHFETTKMSFFLFIFWDVGCTLMALVKITKIKMIEVFNNVKFQYNQCTTFKIKNFH